MGHGVLAHRLRNLLLDYIDLVAGASVRTIVFQSMERAPLLSVNWSLSIASSPSIMFTVRCGREGDEP